MNKCYRCNEGSLYYKETDMVKQYKLPDVTILPTSLGRTFFAWCFISNKKYFVLVDISCQKPFVVYVSVFCTKIKVTAKSWSDLCNFYSKVIFF